MNDKIISLLASIRDEVRDQMKRGNGSFITREFDDEELRDMINFLKEKD